MLIFFWVRPCTHYESAEPVADEIVSYLPREPVLAEMFVPKVGDMTIYNRRLPQPVCKHE